MTFQPDLALSVAAHVRWRRYEQGGVILNSLSGEVYKINETGMRLWQLLAEGHSPCVIVPIITGETGVDASHAAADIELFTLSMLGQGLLCPSNLVAESGSSSENK